LIDPQKLTGYALNPKSLKGADKAFMFREHLGFIQQNYQLFLTQQEILRTGWIVKPNEDIARFVTAYIRSRK
jgi:hypothetical protein